MAQKPETPVIVVGLPKTGTSSLHHFLKCGGYNSSHWKCFSDEGPRQLCGNCFEHAFSTNQSALAICGNWEAWTQLDHEYPPCSMPQVTRMKSLIEEAPHAHFILNVRPVHRWLQSVRSWGSMHERLLQCANVGIPNNATDENLIDWYTNHTRRTIKHLHLAHVRHSVVDIEGPTAGEILSAIFSIDIKCWGHHNKRRNHFDAINNLVT